MPLFTDEITSVQVTAPAEPAIEGHSYKLMCNVTGAATHVYWMKNGELVQEDNTTSLHMKNRTLIFYPLDRNDQGLYQCMASNTVWNVTSPKYQLRTNCEYHNSNGHIIIYVYHMSPYTSSTLVFADGPDEPTIYGQTIVENGKIAYFNCSAVSFPHSSYSWWFNETEVASTPWFLIGPLSFNMSGEYTCRAFNNVTMKNSTNSIMLTVIGKQSSAGVV